MNNYKPVNNISQAFSTIIMENKNSFISDEINPPEMSRFKEECHFIVMNSGKRLEKSFFIVYFNLFI